MLFLTFTEYSQHKAVYYKYSSLQVRTAVYDMGLAEMVGQVLVFRQYTGTRYVERSVLS